MSQSFMCFFGKTRPRVQGLLNTGSGPAGNEGKSGGERAACGNSRMPVGGRNPEDQQRIEGRNHSDSEQVRYQHRADQPDSDLQNFIEKSVTWGR